MKNKTVNVPSIKDPIRPSPGFDKKGLSDDKGDLVALCGFGCAYCSSNMGNYLRINREKFADLTEQQLGERLYPSTSPELTLLWPDFLANLEAQVTHHEGLAAKRGLPPWGTGRMLVISMLTDGFSPVLVANGTTEATLRMLLERTGFRIRVLTKNAVVGSRKWIQLFKSYPGRLTVGLSIGSLDNEWARRIEVGTSSPSVRLEALARLQDAGVPTFGMLCPVFPDVLQAGALEELIDRVRPALVEDFWAEPFNNRTNWQIVRDGYRPGSAGYKWFTEVFEHRNLESWSEYATELYLRVLARARDGGWVHKLHYLLYEKDIVERDAPRFAGLEGVMLQSNPAADGRSANPFIARLQEATGATPTHSETADPQERPRRRLPLLLEQSPAEGPPDEPTAQDQHKASDQQTPAAPKSAECVDIAAAGMSLDDLVSDDGAVANRAKHEKTETTMPASTTRTVVRRRRETQMKGKNKNAARSTPCASQQNPVEVRQVLLADIVVPKHRARRLRDVTALVESIAQTDLIEPIIVRRLPDGCLILVAGLHRFEAHRQLGRESILARIIEVPDDEAELIELDENLARSPLTVFERAEHLERRKQLYERLHPETKHGGAPGKSGGGKKAKDATVASFAEDTFTKTGLSVRTIQDDVKIARLHADAKQAIRGTSLEDQKRVLLQITRIPPEKQAAVATALATGRYRTVGQAVIELGVKDKPKPRSQRGNITARVQGVLELLREAKRRWARLGANLDPDCTPEAEAIGKEIATLDARVNAFARVVEARHGATAIPNDTRPKALEGPTTTRDDSSPPIVANTPSTAGASDEPGYMLFSEDAFNETVSVMRTLEQVTHVARDVFLKAPNNDPRVTPSRTRLQEMVKRLCAQLEPLRGFIDGTYTYSNYLRDHGVDPAAHNNNKRVGRKSRSNIRARNSLSEVIEKRRLRSSTQPLHAASQPVVPVVSTYARSAALSRSDSSVPATGSIGAAPSMLGTGSAPPQTSTRARPLPSRGPSEFGMYDMTKAWALAQAMPPDTVARAMRLVWADQSMTAMGRSGRDAYCDPG